MIGKIFITRSGYDPQVGKHVKDPYLGDQPTLGACRPDIRQKLTSGDHIFVVSGKTVGVEQFVMGGFEVESKIPATAAYKLFPEQRLRLRDDGQLSGNIIVDAAGKQHPLDDHSSFDKRIVRYYPLQGTHYWSVGENLLWSSPDVDAAGALNMWINSPEHRRILLTARWREIGLAAVHVAAAPGTYGGREVTIVTADFGVRR